MRILLDECVHAGVRGAFPGHAVRTVTQIGWRGTGDGPLLSFAQDHFDVFVTIDRTLERQLKLETFKIGFLLVHVRDNRLVSYRPLFEELKNGADAVSPGQVLHIGDP